MIERSGERIGPPPTMRSDDDDDDDDDRPLQNATYLRTRLPMCTARYSSVFIQEHSAVK